MKICFVFEGYPTNDDPFEPFVREIVLQLSMLGVQCSVIAPQSVMRGLKMHKFRPLKWTEKDEKGNIISIYQPLFFSFSRHLVKYKNASFLRATKRAFRKLKGFDALYAHFWHNGLIASMLNDELPLFVACGENKISVNIAENINRLKERVKGVIYVSNKSLEEATRIGLQDKQNYIVAPNGFNKRIFHPVPRTGCRKKLGWDFSNIVLCFVGAFAEHKGPLRVVQAVKKINSKIQDEEDKIKMCFIGRGSQTPEDDNIVFCGSVPHDSMATYLCASNIFILPSFMEGCSNAIIEALGCGLPIIASDRSFNYDALDGSCSLLIDPESIDEIADAIYKLYSNNKLREELSSGSITKAERFTIDLRAERIYDFISSNLNMKHV